MKTDQFDDSIKKNLMEFNPLFGRKIGTNSKLSLKPTKYHTGKYL
jgi:hypothetical protein